MKWNEYYIIGWIVILTSLAVWELYAVFTNSQDPPLTQVTVRYVPWWITMPFIIWLFIHFLVRYINPAYIEKLKS